MLFKQHHYKAIAIIAIASVFVAFFSYFKKVGADLATNLSWCGSNVGSIGITLAECTSLAHLYNETSGDNWTNNNNWFVTTLLTGWGGPNTIIINGGHIVRLNLNNNNLSGAIVQGLDDLLWLTGTNLSANYITNIDVSNNLLLEDLAVLTNQLTGINVSANTLLKRLYVGANPLTTVNVTNNPNLIILHAGSAQLTGINLNNNGLLQELYLLNNNFTWFDASNLPALRLLNMSLNQLTGVDISQNLSLMSGYFYNNQLTYLDTTNNNQLSILWLLNNNLTGIDLTNNTGLVELNIDFNNLTGLDISQNTGLLELTVRGNGINILTVANAGDYPLAINTNYAFSGNNLCYLETVTAPGLNRVTFLNQQNPTWQNEQYCSPNQLSISTGDAEATLSWLSPDGYFDTGDVTSNFILRIDSGPNIPISGTALSYLATGLTNGVAHDFVLCAHTAEDAGMRPDPAGVCSQIYGTPIQYIPPPPPPQSGGGSDGYGGGLVLDECPNGDTSPSNHDGTCGTPEEQEPEPEVVITEIDPEEPMLPAPSLPDSTSILPAGALNCPNPISQYNEAFEFAFQYKITTMPTCAKAYMNGKLIRKDAAKMIVNFVKNVMGKQPDRSIHCEFRDMYGADKDAQKYAIQACQLGLMGLRGDGSPASTFAPDKAVDKKQFSTIVSRMLFGDMYNTSTNKKSECWYCSHVNALWNVGIIKNTSGLDQQFNRGFAFIMLMRALKER